MIERGFQFVSTAVFSLRRDVVASKFFIDRRGLFTQVLRNPPRPSTRSATNRTCLIRRVRNQHANPPRRSCTRIGTRPRRFPIPRTTCSADFWTSTRSRESRRKTRLAIRSLRIFNVTHFCCSDFFDLYIFTFLHACLM